MTPNVSVIICTRNRADSLVPTLESIARCKVPPDMTVEVLVVDNGSTDHTAQVAAEAARTNPSIRYVNEPRSGKSYAYNQGLAASVGRALLFTDDDVRVPPDWIESMARPILAGESDAIAGGVRIAPHLLRPWMTALHRSWLASTEYLHRTRPQEMVGANMAFGRHVLDRVPQFDPELGPGALGQSDDQLFSLQLLRAGFTIAPRLDVECEHHFEASRLTRASFLRMALNRGRCRAHLLHHWEHDPIDLPWLRLVHAWSKLWLLRTVLFWQCLPREGMRQWEMQALLMFHTLRHWLRERNRSPEYGKFGLVRISSPHG